MPRYETHRVLTGDLSNHPAVVAWGQLRNERTKPESVVVLKERRKQKESKPAVYRLDGIGPSGDGVIAKRCPCALAATERTIYEQVLPCIPVPSLDYYGSIDEQQGKFSWIFLQDAGKDVYVQHDAQHRSAAATWLGTVHVFARHIEAAQALPDRGLAYYQNNLRTARALIRDYLDHTRDEADETAALQSILAHADRLEFHWDRLERLCDALPMTLVHGDLVAKNIRLRVNHDGIAILPFDWAYSGWGTPVVDLAQSSFGSTRFSADPDLVTYCTVVHGELPRLQAQTVDRLAQAGTVLRLLNAIYWAALGLSHGWVQRLIRNLTIYEAGLADAVRVLNSVL